jgi:hypothetical protein
MAEERVGKYDVPVFYAEWSAGTQVPWVEVKSRFSTRDRSIDLSRKGAAPLTRAEVALYTAPTELIPCDGLVRETALLMAQITDLLDRWKPAGSGFQWVDTIYEQSQTLRDIDGVTRHGILSFRVLTFQ